MVVVVVAGGLICLGRPPGVRFQPAGTEPGEASSYLVGSAKEGEGAIGHPERAIASLFGISSVVLEPLGV